MRVFINHTNHPSANWSEAQLKAAEKYGRIRDIPFPAIEPDWDEAEIGRMAREQAKHIVAYEPAAVLVQGEFTYSYALIGLLQKAGIEVLAACSRRCTESVVNEQQETVCRSVFRFVRFRRYS